MSDKINKGMRVFLDTKAQERIIEAKEFLKSKSCKATPSRVASWVVEIFFEKYFKNEAKNFEKEFFDKKSYIKNILRKSFDDDENLSDSLRELLVKVRPKKAAKPKKVQRSIDE